MALVQLWARVGVTLAVDLSDNPTRTEIEDKIIEVLKENDPGKLHCFFDGEAYIPGDVVREITLVRGDNDEPDDNLYEDIEVSY